MLPEKNKSWFIIVGRLGLLFVPFVAFAAEPFNLLGGCARTNEERQAAQREELELQQAFDADTARIERQNVENNENSAVPSQSEDIPIPPVKVPPEPAKVPSQTVTVPSKTEQAPPPALPKAQKDSRSVFGKADYADSKMVSIVEVDPSGKETGKYWSGYVSGSTKLQNVTYKADGTPVVTTLKMGDIPAMIEDIQKKTGSYPTVEASGDSKSVVPEGTDGTNFGIQLEQIDFGGRKVY
ncbi:MAG: hypothetical protein G01um101418_519 [Parcubacteria group bacterium Gr01-1014_18]|nr:MAG: hypothetical protein Greene041636_565 [Parcubacteria group bacterium Greene0416_36]TSC80982.1 MAG: hypothetical protein G01um101418_519 [Parcubacteria group bacterium Gr01-1014_18]TSC98869.1 MAG: hypothetical protein Greene101420_502 [Parcubacteria group bacterium Greene1014_20]TSD06545.1 MAG: hypothetical protein Greene07142_820 [Parcubacteria group bacterium Greene0714_2]